MRGSRRNKIHPRGNAAIVRSIPPVFPQYSYPHPRETRGFRGIPAVPIPVHTSSQNWTTATSLSLIFCDISHSFSWHSASHSPSAIAELLVLLFDCSCQPEIMQLIKELSLLVYPQYTSGSKLLQLGSSSTSKVSRYTSEIPSLPLFALMDLYLFIRKVCCYILLL